MQINLTENGKRETLVQRIFKQVSFLATVLLLSLFANACMAARLYIFYPTDIRPKSLQEKINQSCTNINTVAFGRVVDFYRQVNQVPPNAIISLRPVVHRQEPFIEKLKVFVCN